ncbi:hypothetical protein [Stenotrophomonas sp.]|uniref:DUF6946 family protein n=1 Tax=Stenotrophomonas sp. TaxID=69392 RepID=UPI0028AB5CB7|nr:hypothetical protein [Stenotrophomonas sp.]
MPISKNGRPISTIEEWQQRAPPKAVHHWVDGRSAKEVARAWLSASSTAYPTEVQFALVEHPKFGPVLSWECEPEAKLPFDSFPGEPRNSDLAISATDSFGTYVLAVEAKADEPYGETVAETFSAALERGIENQRSNGIARIQGLAAFLFRPRAASPKVGGLRYQLLTACAGAAAEATRRQASRAVMLVHEFITPATQDVNHERNASDLLQFLHRLGGKPIEGFKDGQLYGPFSLPGAPGVELFVGKVKRTLRPDHA